MKNEKSNPNKTIDAKNAQRMVLPKKILFPSKSDKGIRLKKA